MRQILIFNHKRLMVSDRTGDILSIYKVFFPPETAVQLTKKHIVKIEDINPFPPPEQAKLMDLPEEDKHVTKMD